MIRRYQTSDKDQVVRLLQAVLPDSQPHNEPGRALARKQAVDDLMFVATDNPTSTITGFVLVGYDGHRGWIYSLAVLPEYRHHGVARALVERSITELKQLGCEKVNLQVRANNESVQGFYESLGFDVEDRISMGKLI